MRLHGHITATLTEPSELSSGTKHSLSESGIAVWDLAGDGWKDALYRPTPKPKQRN